MKFLPNANVLSNDLFNLFFIFLFGLCILFIFHFRRKIYIVLITLPRDLRFVFKLLRVGLEWIKYAIMGETIVSLFKKTVATKPDKVIFHFQNTSWTVQELDLYSNKVARIFQRKGFKKGDVVALLCLNRPEYVGIWLGLAKIGVVTALINTNLRSQSLIHSVNTSKCKAFIFSYEFVKDVEEIREALVSNVECMVFGSSTDDVVFDDNLKNYVNMEELLYSTSGYSVKLKESIKPSDKVMYIYTSGTTGLPKAAILLHNKLVIMAPSLKHVLNIRENDVIYNPFPLYHSLGGLLGTLPALVYGVTVVIKVKFSAKDFFADCVRYKCTVGMYIGEICRYLLASPPSPNDVNHSLRMIMGIGLRRHVWQDFVRRFKISNIIEFYGCTEGNANLLNIDNTIGAVGFIPRILPVSVLSIVLIKYDEMNDEPVRDENGFCIKCNAGQSGMCIGMISKLIPHTDFLGYADQDETKKKIIRNVFSRGDSAFISGDILYMDEFGYVYFKDRIGDTFRWKGENVSTSEVEMIIQKLINYKDCTVYGVQVGDLEGKAGMVAIVDPENEVNLNDLARNINENLPVYARPLFLRILPQLELTGTYKIKKNDLKKQSFDPSKTQDRLYFKHSVLGFLPITKTLYNEIATGAVRM